MNKETLAIVSSYDELCGNASYTKALVKELSSYFDVTVVPLDVDLLRKGNNKRIKQHIQKTCDELRTFDCVNIQLEAGLFGGKISSIQNNFLAVAKASKKLVVTMHRYQSREKYPGIRALGKHLLFRSIRRYVKEWKIAYANNRYVPFYRSVIKYCQSNDIPVIAHTKRDRKNIMLDFDYDKIYDHPLCFYSQDEIKVVKDNYSKETFCKDLGLDKDKKYIGIFGFINAYKGHETAIRSLIYLPQNYELLICGTQHPHTIRLEESINPYIKDLLKVIDTLGLSTRVHFHRLASDEDFLKALIHCDYNVLPYLEVMQGGSAIAALSLESNSKALFSQNLAFFELEKYAQDSFKMFSIGNYIELADAILSYDKTKFDSGLNNYHNKYNIHTSGVLYRDLLSRANDKKRVNDSVPIDLIKATS